ncbi:MAG: FAD-dependent oxidoreductase [Anaerolineae bacterium]
MAHLLIIGGSDAGISAALRAREVDPAMEVTVVVADRFPNYSICGIPFFISGEVPDWHDLAHRTASDIQAKGIRLLLEHTAQAIDPAAKQVTVLDRTGATRELPYDRLIVATGAEPARPQIAGLDLPGVYLLRPMESAFRLHRHVRKREPRSALVIGGGYIGLEMVDAFAHLGMSVTVVEYMPSLMPTVDPSLGRVIGAEVERHGVEVVTGVGIEQIERVGDLLAVRGTGGFQARANLVLVAVGVRPVSGLAAAAGAQRGIRGALRVNQQMETGVAGVYAAGDCIETWHRLLERYVYLPLGTTAHKQGRVAGENAAGGHSTFAGSLGTQVVRVFDLAVARTGLLETEAAQAGFDPLTIELETWDHKAYYPGAHRIHLRVTGDRWTGRLLGAQMVGHVSTQVAKRIDVFATALFHGMAVAALSDLDLSYTPPLSSPWDPVQEAAQMWISQRQGRHGT